MLTEPAVAGGKELGAGHTRAREVNRASQSPCCCGIHTIKIFLENIRQIQAIVIRIGLGSRCKPPDQFAICLLRRFIFFIPECSQLCQFSRRR